MFSHCSTVMDLQHLGICSDPVKNVTKNYCFWTILSKIFQSRPSIKNCQGQLYIPVLLSGLFHCTSGTVVNFKVSLCFEKKNNYIRPSAVGGNN